MPNEAISCPKCGASDVRQSAPDSYVCKHCQANFRWVDPTRMTVAHKPSVCDCGRVAVAFCVRCAEALCMSRDCSNHDSSRIGLAPGDPGRSDSRRSCWARLRTMTVPKASNDETPGWVRLKLDEQKVPKNVDAVLCEKCAMECQAIGESLESSLREEIKQGQARGN